MIHHARETKSETTRSIGGGTSSPVFVDTLNGYAPESIIGKKALCRLFQCSGRTIQRMVARRDLPPPLTHAGERGWFAGMLGQWVADAARRRQVEVEE